MSHYVCNLATTKRGGMGPISAVAPQKGDLICDFVDTNTSTSCLVDKR